MVKSDHGSQTDFELDLSLLNTNWHQIVGECLRILKPHQFLHLNNSDNKISSLQVFWGVRHNYLLNNIGLNCV